MTYPIDGITVLAQHEITTYVGQIWAVLTGAFMIITLGIFIGSLIAESKEGMYIALVFFVLFWTAGIISKTQYKKVETGRYEYQVLIDETVDINEVALHYDIIGQDGLIWTLEDKK